MLEDESYSSLGEILLEWTQPIETQPRYGGDASPVMAEPRFTTAEKEKNRAFEPNEPIEEKEEVLENELPWAGINNPTMETILEQ